MPETKKLWWKLELSMIGRIIIHVVHVTKNSQLVTKKIIDWYLTLCFISIFRIFDLFGFLRDKPTTIKAQLLLYKLCDL